MSKPQLSHAVALSQSLIQRNTVTPEDAGCQQLIADRLAPLGFTAEHIERNGVKNLWLRRGKNDPLLCFAGHTDVVPTGPAEHWKTPPFSGLIKDGILHGRGAADMKSGVAAMTVAAEEFVRENPNFDGSIALLVTSDEEGPAKDGTAAVIEALEARGEKITWCVVGEPSSTTRVGDTIKNGRRGSLSGTLEVFGKQGHVAYPHLAENPIHSLAPFLQEISQKHWDDGNQFFPPTTFQVSNLNAGTGATNVVPGRLQMRFNFRFGTASSEASLREAVEKLLNKHELKYEISWNCSGQPFITEPGSLTDAASEAILEICGIETELSTSGGTSDGRFIAPTGAQVIELGVCNATIHQVDERIACEQIDVSCALYKRMLEKLFL
ncbi:MAG: succinyl-diaminopimelate desuccinylase [Granulosicoccaceae bacterium]